MKVVVIGSGAREHVLAWKIANSSSCDSLYILPGNGGTSTLGKNVPISTTDFPSIATFCEQRRVDCIVVGPEVPLVEGISDYLTDKLPYIQIIGPNAEAAKLEGSKVFAKQFMQRYGIRTSSFRSFEREEISSALRYVREISLPHVLKADGLAAGKGVVISYEVETSCYWLEKLLLQKYFGTASARVLVEEYVEGVELSCFVLCQGEDYLLLPEAKDYKKVGKGDTGPNTGGMGAVSSVAFVDKDLRKKIEAEIVRPTLSGLVKEGITYSGFLFFGLMIREGLPYVLEYNVRLGDPEAQVLLPRIETDLLTLFSTMREKKLSSVDLSLSSQIATAITIAAEGYPSSYKKGTKIEELSTAEANGSLVFHAGTELLDKTYYSTGGRVLSVVAMGDDLSTSLEKAYDSCAKIHYPGSFYREDIGSDLLPKKAF